MERILAFDNCKFSYIDLTDLCTSYQLTILNNLDYIDTYLVSRTYSIILINSDYGIETVCKTIRRIKKDYPNTIIIVSVSEERFSHACRFIDAGADNIIAHFFSGKELIKKIEIAQKKYMNSISGYQNEGFCSRYHEYIVDNFNTKITQDKLLEIASLSRSTIYRQLKAKYGKSKNEIQHDRKIESAKELLIQNQLPIGAIGFIIGINDQNYFSRWFKKHTGLSPTSFRDKYKITNDNIRIGLLLPLTGAYESCGLSILEGARIALDKILSKHGYSYSLIPIDTGTDPVLCHKRMKYHIEAENVQYFTGGISSDVIQSAISLANEKKVIFVNTQGIDNNDKCPPTVFHWPLPSETVLKNTLFPVFEKYNDFKNCFTLTANYSFGHRLLDCTKRLLEEYKIPLCGNFFHNLGEKNFYPHLKKLIDMNARYIILLNYGPDTMNVLEQARAMGIHEDVVFIVPSTDLTNKLLQLGSFFPEGVFLGSQYYTKEPLTENEKFISMWQSKYTGIPSPVVVGGYLGVKLICKSIERTRNLKIEDNIRVMETLKWKGLTKPIEYMIAESHQVQKNYFLINPKQ